MTISIHDLYIWTNLRILTLKDRYAADISSIRNYEIWGSHTSFMREWPHLISTAETAQWDKVQTWRLAIWQFMQRRSYAMLFWCLKFENALQKRSRKTACKIRPMRTIVTYWNLLPIFQEIDKENIELMARTCIWHVVWNITDFRTEFRSCLLYKHFIIAIWKYAHLPRASRISPHSHALPSAITYWEKDNWYSIAMVVYPPNMSKPRITNGKDSADSCNAGK